MRSPQYMVVESYPGYSKHIRKLASEEEPKLSGISSKPVTLCGKVIETGWDTKIPLPKSMTEWKQSEKWHRFCLRCADLYRGVAVG